MPLARQAPVRYARGECHGYQARSARTRTLENPREGLACAEETVNVEPGSVDLTATANSGFMLGSGPWHDTTTQSGGSATLKVTSGSMCVWVCCPGTGGSPACPTADQCP
jgi:hypothetical protein